MIEDMLHNTRLRTPFVHCITNYITANDCANILLACGGSPIMADDPLEVEEITKNCNGLVINIGTLNERKLESMIIAGKKANSLGRPVILDPVGVGVSTFRLSTVHRLLQEIQFAVIRGNISEIKSIWSGVGSSTGVDVNPKDKITTEHLIDIIQLSRFLSKKTGAIIGVTGETDIVSSSKKTYIINNGHSMMSKITGSGCMLSAVIGAYCAANDTNILEATASAICAMGLCGEIAHKKILSLDCGTASFRIHLIDAMSKLDKHNLKKGAKYEIR